MEIIDILKKIMAEQKFNQREFAEKIGYKQSQVSEWLGGKSKPGYDSLQKICKATKVKASFLLGLDDNYSLEEKKTGNNSLDI